jgi:hypothetical protein
MTNEYNGAPCTTSASHPSFRYLVRQIKLSELWEIKKHRLLATMQTRGVEPQHLLQFSFLYYQWMEKCAVHHVRFIALLPSRSKSDWIYWTAKKALVTQNADAGSRTPTMQLTHVNERRGASCTMAALSYTFRSGKSDKIDWTAIEKK